jgi:uncharacterized repeat protein (TIGR02543 family)
MTKLDFFKYAVLTALVVFFAAGCGDKEGDDKTYYTITFDSQGGESVSPITLEAGTVTMLPSATREGYTFDGWFSASSGGTKYGEEGEDRDLHTLTGNVTMYAQWTEIEPTKYTLWFSDLQGGNTIPTITEAEGTSIILPTPTRSGYYTFIGWFSEDGETRYGGAGDSYTITNHVTMYAQWTQGVMPLPDLGANGSGSDGDTMTINGIACVLVKAGSFTMGVGANPDFIFFDGPTTQEVTLTNDYWLGKYPVTQAQYEAVMGNNPSEYSVSNNPVENVTWDNVNDFCRVVGARLPTEAEWEFAARGGNNSNGYIYSGSNDLDEVGWYYGNNNTPPYKMKPVGQKLPNELGLYDMSGNVWEFCGDWSGEYSASAVVNPTGPSTGEYRIIRGGNGTDAREYECRVAFRGGRNTTTPGINANDNNTGFRVAFPRN